MVNYLDSRRIAGTTAERSSVPIPATAGGWVELGRTTLGSAGDDITISSLSDKRYYMILGYTLPSGVNRHSLRFNSDTGSNYAWRKSYNGGADATEVSNSKANIQDDETATNEFSVTYLANIAGNEKLTISHDTKASATGAASANNRQETVCKWANTSNAVNAITLHNPQAGDFAANSECVVLGWDPTDTHTTNFWEELASVELSSDNDVMDTGTFTAKKYLWVQFFTKNNQAWYGQFNSDTGNNYSFRYSANGSADGTSTSRPKGFINYTGNTTGIFGNLFIINNQSNEKLIIQHNVEGSTAGAGNAPYRLEAVGKWANTSTQITSVQIRKEPSFAQIKSGSFIKVWGSD